MLCAPELVCMCIMRRATCTVSYAWFIAFARCSKLRNFLHWFYRKKQLLNTEDIVQQLRYRPIASHHRQHGSCGQYKPRAVDSLALSVRGRTVWTHGCCGICHGILRYRGTVAALSTTRYRISPRSSTLSAQHSTSVTSCFGHYNRCLLTHMYTNTNKL